MERDQFDILTRQMGRAGSRRQALRALGSIIFGSALGGVATRLGLAKGTAAKSKRKRRANQEPQGALQAERRRNKKRKKAPRRQRCSDLVPLCPSRCYEPRCDAATGEYVCHWACPAGFSCCNGRCEPPCDNGCEMNPNQACSCESPPAGQQYCAADHVCIDADECCPDKTRCDDGSCVSGEGCCSHAECGDYIYCCQGTCCENLNYRCSRDGCCPLHFICSDGRCDPRCFHDTCDPPENCP